MGTKEKTKRVTCKRKRDEKKSKVKKTREFRKQLNFAIGKIHQGTLVSKKMLGGLAVMNALAGIIEPVKEQQKWTL